MWQNFVVQSITSKDRGRIYKEDQATMYTIEEYDQSLTRKARFIQSLLSIMASCCVKTENFYKRDGNIEFNRVKNNMHIIPWKASYWAKTGISCIVKMGEIRDIVKPNWCSIIAGSYTTYEVIESVQLSDDQVLFHMKEQQL